MSEATYIKSLLDKYEDLGHGTVWDLVDRIEELKDLDVDSEALEDYEAILKFVVRNRQEAGLPANEEFRIVDSRAVDFDSHYGPDNFPREWFLDHVNSTPKFNVGDILFRLDFEEADPERPVIDEVVVTCVMSDIMGVSYFVAAHNVDARICESYAFEVGEEYLSFSRAELDPRRKNFAVVK